MVTTKLWGICFSFFFPGLAAAASLRFDDLRQKSLSQAKFLFCGHPKSGKKQKFSPWVWS